ncbi:Major facilitator superfamily locus tagral substrate transporter [Echinococcus multilocularis]|uniref:Major facilitator superfamily locus tagral substrate transporter n=1 Tax=Echinococcus multilocularis TaxID=6211 RepID=A0A068Y976_ECHMU|nr:Major facilitator superfamily locus tagral substrate transporter [Echinococcus multilocularis]
MVFDKESSFSLPRNGYSKRSSPFALCSFIVTFVIIGLSVSVSGPSVMFLEELVYTWEDEIALVFTGRSVGALGGWLLSVAILEDAPKHCGSLIGFGLFGLTVVNFGIAFSYHLWWLLAAFAFQGGFIVVAAQGCLAYVTKYSESPKRFHQLLVFCSLAGCALTPILFIPFTFEAGFICESSASSLADASTSVSDASVIHTILRPSRSLNDESNHTISKSVLSNQTTEVFVESIRVTTSQPSNIFIEHDTTNTAALTSTIVVTPQLSGSSAQYDNWNASVPMPSVSDVSSTPSVLKSFVNSSTAFVDPVGNKTHMATSSKEVFKVTTSSLNNTSEAPMKPSVVDAEHLNQDSSSADGSNTAAKMKLADGDVRLTKSKDSGVLDGPGDDEMEKLSVVDGSSTADAMKQDEKIHGNDPKLSILIIPSLAPHELESESITNGTIVLSKPPILTTTIPLLKNNSISSPMLVEGLPQNHESKPRSNDSYRLTSSYNTKWDRRTPRRRHNERIRYHYMKSVRYVYVSVGLLTIMAWFILLPLTGLIPYVRHVFECFTVQTSHRLSSQIEDQSHRGVFSAKPSDDVETMDFPGDPQPEISSLTENESPPPQIASKNVGWSAKGGEGQLQEKPTFHVSVSVPNFAVLRSVRHNTSQAHRKNMESSDIDANDTFETPEQSVYLNYAPEPTIWPLVTWPKDFWVLAATFLFAGLETTYGAFIHSFTLKTLNWTPVGALLVTTVFWSGDAIGRLCHLCLGASSDMGISLLQNAVNFSSKENPQSPSTLPARRSCRREKSFHIAALFIRTVAPLICFICASMMKELTPSHPAYCPRSDQSGNAMFESWSTSKDRATWMATLGLGLGLGATAGSGLNVYNSRGHRLYLAFLLGQLAVPATSGYLTERVLHKNASETLGRTTIILSILMLLSLLIDLLLIVVRRFFWWKIVTNWFSYLFEEEKEKLETKRDAIGTDEHAQPKESLVDVAWGSLSLAPAIPLETRQKNDLNVEMP